MKKIDNVGWSIPRKDRKYAAKMSNLSEQFIDDIHSPIFVKGFYEACKVIQLAAKTNKQYAPNSCSSFEFVPYRAFLSEIEYIRRSAELWRKGTAKYHYKKR